MRDGPRSVHTALTRAVLAELNRRVRDSPLRTVHGLSRVVHTVSRSQMYLIMRPRGDTVMDMAELAAICAAIGAPPWEVVKSAEDALDRRKRAVPVPRGTR